MKVLHAIKSKLNTGIDNNDFMTWLKSTYKKKTFDEDVFCVESVVILPDGLQYIVIDLTSGTAEYLHPTHQFGLTPMITIISVGKVDEEMYHVKMLNMYGIETWELEPSGRLRSLVKQTKETM